MKTRVTVSLDSFTAEHLRRRAAAETGGNVSALVNKILRNDALTEALRAANAWDKANPEFMASLIAELDGTGMS